MRLDQFLKLSRLVKRRTLAREMCDAGRVLLNGHEAKPARDVKPGDVITLKYFTRVIEAEVLDIVAPGAGKKLPPAPFRILTDTRLTETETHETGETSHSHHHGRSGWNRP
jgi:ribosomal 50S subunit-recycling heat shock protein